MNGYSIKEIQAELLLHQRLMEHWKKIDIETNKMESVAKTNLAGVRRPQKLRELRCQYIGCNRLFFGISSSKYCNEHRFDKCRTFLRKDINVSTKKDNSIIAGNTKLIREYIPFISNQPIIESIEKTEQHLSSTENYLPAVFVLVQRESEKTATRS